MEDLIAAAVSITALTALFVLAVLTVRPFLPAEVVRRSRRGARRRAEALRQEAHRGRLRLSHFAKVSAGSA